MTARRRALLLTVTVTLAGCSDEATPAAAAPASYQLLVSAGEWRELPRSDDPFVGDGAEPPACSPPSFFVEDDWVEVDTGLCHWVTLEADARFAVKLGAQLRLVVSHYDLSALAPAEATVTLRFGGCAVWQETIAIPGPAMVYTEELRSPCSVDRAGPLLFHLDNHGQNTWQLQELSVLR